MHKTYAFPTPTPKDNFAPGRVLRESWLPLTTGKTDLVAYDAIADSLLCEMFDQTLHYGPHIDEMKEYLTSFVDLFEIAGITNVSAVADSVLVQQLRLDFIRTYSPQIRAIGFGASAGASDVERITKNMIDPYTYLPKQFRWDYGQVVGNIKLDIVSEVFKEVMSTPVLKNSLGLSLSLILLQYAYLPELLLDDSGSLYAKRATQRNLLRGHNAFCEKYGLPTLQYASDAHINSVR